MNSNQSTHASAVAALQQEIRTRTEVIRTLADLREQLDADRICGAWLSAENNLSASIRRIGEGMWRILVFDHALCYKRLVQDGIIALRRHRLWLGADDGNRVIYDASTETPVSSTQLRAHETKAKLVCRLLLEKKKYITNQGQRERKGLKN